MEFTISILTLVSVCLGFWQWIAGKRFPLHRRTANPSFAPGVTILKPLKGKELRTRECLQSWMEQHYSGETQILFGVASADDPVCDSVRELIQSHPGSDAELVICSKSIGANGKVSTLIQLEHRAKHEFILISDADVLAPLDLLANIVMPLQNTEVGIVNCFYRIADPANLAMRWEATGTNADFWSQVLQGHSLQALDFALGAVMITRRQQLHKIGGFRALTDYLADDFQLGNRIFNNGYRIELSTIVADCHSSPQSWLESWGHQLRWARTIRVCKPVPYAMSILSNATLWPLLWMALYPSTEIALIGSLCVAFRILTAAHLQYKLEQSTSSLAYWWLVPFKDIAQSWLWMSAFFGNQITWRGQRYRVHADGRLAPLEPFIMVQPVSDRSATVSPDLPPP